MLKLLNHKKSFYGLIITSLFLRVIVALTTNLNNDEVYYALYALNPDISYFDHPPFVGYIIRLFTLNNHFLYHDFFVRLGSLILGSINLILIYKIGVLLKSKQAGLFAALLCMASFYASIIAGTFILPDTPLSLFWLLSVYSFLKFTSDQRYKTKWILLFGIFVGLGLLSKYQAIYLWLGAIGYFFFYDRKKLLDKHVLISVIISFLLFSPVIIWNLTSNYSGINYHYERVNEFNWVPNFINFSREVFGQIFYHNPFNVLIIILSLVFVFKQGIKNIGPIPGFLLLVGLPLIVTTLIISLYNKTLPHWSGPGYYSLILIAGIYYSSISNEIQRKRLRRNLALGLIIYHFVIIAALIQANTGIITKTESDITKVGKYDLTVDLGNWRKNGELISRKIYSGMLKDTSLERSIILTHNWFPAAHIDYYYALPDKRRLYVWGERDQKHEYLRINKLRGEVLSGTDAFYITTSTYFQKPDSTLLNKFSSSEGPEILPVKTHGRTRANVFIWKLVNLQEDTSF